MEHDGESGQTAGNLLQNVEPQRRGHQNALLVPGTLLGGELISAVGGADGDGQRVTAGLLHKLLYVLGTGVGAVSYTHLVAGAVLPVLVQSGGVAVLFLGTAGL